MNYKHPITVLALILLFNIQGLSQTSIKQNGALHIVAVGYSGPIGQNIIMQARFDTSTQAIYPSNYLNGRTSVTNTNFVYVEGGHYLDIFTSIPKEELPDYRYRVLVNDTTELVHWQKPDFRKNALLFDPLPVKIPVDSFPAGVLTSPVGCRLALINYEDKKITVQMYNIYKPNDVTTVYFYNKPVPKPVIKHLINAVGYQEKDGGLVTEFHYIESNSESKGKGIFLDSLKSIWPVIYKNDANLLYQIYVKNLSKPESLEIRIPSHWIHLGVMRYGNHEFSYSPIPNYVFSSPGKYQITIVPQLPGSDSIHLFRDKAASITFEVFPSPQKFTLAQMVPYFGGFILLSGLGFWQYKRHQNKKLQNEIRKREVSKVQLESVRSQLNPHFIFNALANIQNLMNKKETENANQYLSQFSRFTRSALENTENDLISLSEEKLFLEDYLQMEQMRFGFQYKIHIDRNIDKTNQEIPSMLVQPFVENAVKHGVADLKKKGIIEVSFKKKAQDLGIEITDNGGGFDIHKEKIGFGLKLSRKRIALLNEVYKEALLRLKIDSGKNGTIVSIKLQNWI